MNILNLLKYSPDFGGGVAKHLLSLSDFATAAGHKMFFGFPEKRDWQNELVHNSRIFIIPELNASYSPSLPGVLNDICKSNSIDILHLHFNFGIPFSLASSIKNFNLPVVYHWHNPPIALNNFLTSPSSAKAKLKRMISTGIAKYTDARVIDMHISISNEITDMLIRNRWTKKKKITFLPNGVVSPESQMGIKKLKSEKVVVGTIANFRPQKDHETLIRAFSILIKEGYNLELQIVGEGLTRSSIERLAEELNVSSKIKFLGTVLNPSRVFEEFDIFVLSTHYEGHPLVILEAMSYNLPIIATNISSIPEVVQDKVNGLLVNPKDPDALAFAIKTLSQDEELYNKFSMAAGKSFREQITVSQWSERVLAIYKSLLEKY